MANWYKSEFNSLIENANGIYDYLSGNYLNDFVGREIQLSSNQRIDIGNMMFYKIKEYRLFDDKKEFKKTVAQALARVFENCYVAKSAIGYFLAFHEASVSLFLGYELKSDLHFGEQLTASIPDIKYENRFIDSAFFKRLQSSCVVTGIPSQSPDIDQLITSAMGKECIIALLAKPMGLDAVNYRKKALDVLLHQCESLKTVDFHFGEGSRRTVSRPQPRVMHLFDYLQTQQSRFAEFNHFWQSCVWVCAKNSSECTNISRQLAGLYSYSEDNISRKGRYFSVNVSPFSNLGLFLPNVAVGDIPQQAASLKFSSLCECVSTNEFAAMAAMPVEEHTGILPIRINASDTDIHVFSTAGSSYNDGFQFGKNVYSGLRVQIPISVFKRHALVVGSSGYGKTTAVMNLLTGLNANQVPFCVIEATKKEYFQLINHVNNLNVYSVLDDGIPLRLNLFEPEPGVVISNHIDEISNVFNAAFEMEEATRSAIKDLIRYTYEQKGINVDDYYYEDLVYPSLSDLIANIEPFCATQLHYDPRGEVAGNIRGSILNRLNALNSGAVKKVLNVQHGIKTEELFFKNTIIELDGISPANKSLIASILLIKFNEYAHTKGNDDRLQNCIVLEEAHNIIGKISGNRDSSKDMASNYFAELLSSIRSFGTGVIIADQGATNLHSRVINNTSLKIVMHSEDENDMDMIRYALGMNDLQMRFGARLNTGEALLSLGGTSQTQLVKVDYIDTNNIENLACLFCDSRFLCNKSAVYAKTNAKRYEWNQYADRLYRPFTKKENMQPALASIAQDIGVDKRDAFCAVGKVLTDFTLKNMSVLLKRKMLYRIHDR